MSSRYRPGIDGLRAVALVLVLMFHAFPSWVPGGFAGVDVFFVISGYLIGGLVLGEHEHGSFRFRRFYARRIRRLFPALIVVMVAVFVFGLDRGRSRLRLQHGFERRIIRSERLCV